jgi:hypothetical protein
VVCLMGVRQTNRAQLAITFTAVLFASVAYFFATQISLMVGVAVE